MTQGPGLKLRVGGVPEHFNLPWHLAREQGFYEKHGVEVEWVEQKEETGQMINSLKEGKVDVVIALTEGLVAGKLYPSSPSSLMSDEVLTLLLR
jgi:sulfonate transport system substrate-binding protein